MASKILVSGTVAVVIALGLGGCTPPDVVIPPMPETVSVPTPSPTATAAVIEVPLPSIDVRCDDLLTDVVLNTLFAAPIATVDPAETITDADHLIPYTYAVQQIGGVACELSNGEPQSEKTGSNANYRGILLTLVPIEGASTSSIANYPGGFVNCFDDTGISCSSESFDAGGWWLSISVGNADNVGSPKAAQGALTAIIDSVVAAVDAAPASGATWQQPVGTLEVPTDCDQFITASTLADNLDLAKSIEISAPFGPGSADSFSRTALDAMWCNYLIKNTFSGEGALYWLPGGEWAWQQQSGFESIVSSGITPLDVPGLVEGDGAWERCDAQHYCVIDLLVGHNWVEFVRWPETSTKVKKHDANLAIATSIYRSLRF
jgi:hypothetical protein